MPWQDVWGTIAVVGISAGLATVAFKNGRFWYRTGLYFSLGNLAISVLALLGNDGFLIGGWWAIPYVFAVSAISYFAVLGGLVTFRYPKNVKCFRCEYVDYPSETDEEMTRHDEEAWRAFRALNAEFQRKGGVKAS